MNIKEYQTLPGGGFNLKARRQSRIIEVDKAPKGAEVTEEAVRDWADDPQPPAETMPLSALPTRSEVLTK